MMDTALSRFQTSLRSVRVAQLRGDRLLAYALLIPLALLLLLLDWNVQLFLFLGLAYASAFLGFMIAFHLGALVRQSDQRAYVDHPAWAALEQEKEQLEQLNRQLTLELTMREENKQPASAPKGDLQRLMASHELRDPLRTMQGFIRLLQDRHLARLDREGQDFLHYISDNARRMEDMIDHLQVFSGISGPTRVREGVDGNFLVADVLRFMGPRIRETRAIVRIDELPRLAVDPQQAGQLLQNLIDNALKFCEADIPQLHLSAEETPRHWTLRLRDNGIGIAPEFHEVVFDLFRRLHGVGTYAGTGIGLAIGKRIVDNHGGRLWVESAGPGWGSTFCIALPKPGEAHLS